MTVLFYHHNDPLGCFSNFSRHLVDIYGRIWRTSEHAFQAMKFHHSPEHMQLVHWALTPGEAARLGRDRSFPLRPDWDAAPPKDIVERFVQLPVFEDGIDRRGAEAEYAFRRVKDIVMYEVCLAKFEQNEEARKELLGTGDEQLIEDTRSSGDAYWGWGPSQVGQNKLGRILMTVRQQLR